MTSSDVLLPVEDQLTPRFVHHEEEIEMKSLSTTNVVPDIEKAGATEIVPQTPELTLNYHALENEQEADEKPFQSEMKFKTDIYCGSVMGFAGRWHSAILVALFVVCYSLLILLPECVAAHYTVLITSLALILRYTIAPSFVMLSIGESSICSSIRVPLDQATVPLMTIGLLLLSGDDAFTFESAWHSVLGTNSAIKPWLVLGILFCLIYQCITLNATGILKGLAKKTVQIAGSNPNVLMVTLWLFASALTVATNNDISIIVMTPLVLEMEDRLHSVDPLSFLFMVLFTSNTFSMLLISGNPANLIVAEAAGLGSAAYIQQMAIPTLIAGLVLGAVIVVIHRWEQKQIGSDDVPKLEPTMSPRPWTSFIGSPKYAVFCILRLLATRIVIGFAEELQEAFDDLLIPMDLILIVVIATFSFLCDFFVFDVQKATKSKHCKDSEMKTLSAVHALCHLPWKLIPFVLSLFVIMRWFDVIGMVDFVAELLLRIDSDDEWTAMFAVGFGSTILAQFINNQPMTVFVSEVLNKIQSISKTTGSGLVPKWLNQSYYALALAANLGGNGTIIASLAVILWRQILLRHREPIEVNYIQFAKRGLSITAITVTVAIVAQSATLMLLSDSNTESKDVSPFCALRHPQYPYHGGGACSASCRNDEFWSPSWDLRRRHYPDSFSTEFVSRYKTAADIIMENGLDVGHGPFVGDEERPSIDYNLDDVHMTLDYFCCYDAFEVDAILESTESFNWTATEVTFDRLICTINYDEETFPGSDNIELMVMVDDESNQRLMEMIEQFEDELRSKGIGVSVPRGDNIGFHVTLAHVDQIKFENLKAMIDRINDEVDWPSITMTMFNDGPVLSGFPNQP